MGKAKGPIKWIGGKGNMLKKLLSLIPDHKLYVEVFGGGAALLFNKQPSDIEVYNDIDQGLFDFFSVLQDRCLFREFSRKVRYTPYSRNQYNHARLTWRDETDLVSRVHKWYIVARQSFGGHFGHSFGTITHTSQRGMAGTCSDWITAIKELLRFHRRIMRVQIENQNWDKIITRYDTANTFFYLDPPYVMSTRKQTCYAHELTDDDHKKIIELALNAQGKVLLSGYQNDIYNRLEAAGWHTKRWVTACHAAGKTKGTKIQGEDSAKRLQPRIEAVWYNY